MEAVTLKLNDDEWGNNESKDSTDKQTNCDSCEDTYPMGYLIPTSDGDSICEECCDIIELAEADENK